MWKATISGDYGYLFLPEDEDISGNDTYDPLSSSAGWRACDFPFTKFQFLRPIQEMGALLGFFLDRPLFHFSNHCAAITLLGIHFRHWWLRSPRVRNFCLYRAVILRRKFRKYCGRLSLLSRSFFFLVLSDTSVMSNSLSSLITRSVGKFLSAQIFFGIRDAKFSKKKKKRVDETYLIYLENLHFT